MTGRDDAPRVVHVEDVRDRLEALYKTGLRPGPSTGWRNVDRLYRPALGQWTILTGIPGMGKSTFLDALLVNLAVKHGFRFVMFSPENFPAERHVAKLVTCYTGKPFQPEHLKGDRLAAALEFVGKHFTWIDPDTATDVHGVLAACEEARKEGPPVHGLVLDPWNEVEHNRGDLSETDYISASLTRIRRYARTRRLHVWVVAHPTKLQKGVDGEYPVPTPYDISGSANWRNKADFALTVHRDQTDPGGRVGLHVQKVRFAENGRVGRADLVFNPQRGQYAPLGTDDTYQEG